MEWLYTSGGLFIFGIILFILGLKELSSNTFKENIFDAVFSSFLGIFELSGVGMLFFGILLTLIGVILFLSKILNSVS